MLRKRGELMFRYRYDGLKQFGFNVAGLRECAPVFQLIIVRVPGIGDVIFDVNDGDIVFKNLYDSSFLYFKRSYCPVSHASFHKMLPLGLNYEARSPGISISAINRALRLSRSSVAMVRSLCRAFHLPRPHILEPKARTVTPIDFRENPRVLFLARTWDPNDMDGPEQEVRQKIAINEMRADCVRRLRSALGDRFTGGIIRSNHAENYCSDCLVPTDLRTDRRSFLRLVETHQICVTTTGQHDSIGWKLAEFLAKGRAVVSEKMRFTVPGPFSEGVNYLSFATGEECVDSCLSLIGDSEARRQMMIANRAYFLGYVSPDSIVRNALDMVAAASQEIS